MNILVRAPNWLGDIVMALPAIETIRRHAPEARLTVAAPPAFVSLCAAAPGVDAVLPLVKGRGRAARAERTRAIHAGQFDVGILLTNSFGSALDLWRAGVPERWGFGADWRGRLLTRAIDRPRKSRGREAHGSPRSADGGASADSSVASSSPVTPPSRRRAPSTGNGRATEDEPSTRETSTRATSTGATSTGEGTSASSTAAPRATGDARRLPPAAGEDAPPRDRHHSEYYLALTTALGMRPVRLPPPLIVSADAAARARALAMTAGWNGASPLVAVASGAAYGFAKRWPPERMAAVVARLTARGLSAVLVGAPADRESARAVESALADGPAGAAAPGAAGRGRCLNLVGQTDLPTLMGLFDGCAAVLSNDSGAMHLASAVGRPVVAVFGPTDDVATAPLGPHAIVRHPVWCRPCLLRECPIDHRCMRGVSPDAVFDALISTIAATA